MKKGDLVMVEGRFSLTNISMVWKIGLILDNGDGHAICPVYKVAVPNFGIFRIVEPKLRIINESW